MPGKELIIPFGMGFAAFLFGLKTMEIALHEWAGPFLSQWMRKFTHTPFRGLLTGTIATALLQSSNAVTVVTIGLVNAKVLTFRQTLGIVLGANIGASLTVDMLGLDMTAFALPMLFFFGCAWLLSLLFSRRTKSIKTTATIRSLSLTLCGFACILIGMEQMNSIVPALQSRGLFVWFLEQSQRSPAWGLVAGLLITAVIQSSAATMAVTLGLAAVQAIPVELGLAIMLGANIGSCSTALLACIGGSRAGQYVAWSHIVLNMGVSLLFFPFIDEIARLAVFGAHSPYEQITHAQTLFNVCCSLIALPFCYIGLRRNG